MKKSESLEECLLRKTEIISTPFREKARTLTLPRSIEISHRFNLSRREVEIAALSQGIIPQRYLRNLESLSLIEQQRLLESKVLVIGLGGLGGTVSEMLARVGIGSLIIADGDRFEENNLNRQAFSSENVLGKSKAKIAMEKLENINGAVDIQAVDGFLKDKEFDLYLNGVNVAVDALDNFPDRFALERKCKRHGVPLVHGAVAGSWGHVSVIYPQDQGLSLIYGEEQELPEKGVETILGNLPSIVGTVASGQVMEVVKIITRKGVVQRNKLFFFDLMQGEAKVIDLMKKGEKNEDPRGNT